MATLVLFIAVSTSTSAADKMDSWVEVRSPHFRVISNAGETQARRVAGQFERFREVLRNTLVKSRLDPATPLLILAVKDEKSLKTLLPQYWETKGSIHPAGFFQRSVGKDFVVLRLDVETVNPYHIIYHEFTHSLMALNFRALPIWVSEGLAEFFGHATIGDKEAGTGHPSFDQMQLLREKRLLPLATLITAERDSPYYNEANKSSIFYAQSWALTHYLMIGVKGGQTQLLKYIALVADGVPDLEAAQQTFGDLKLLQTKLDDYIRQSQYMYLPVKLTDLTDEKQYTLRAVSEAEALATRGDFLMHTQRYTEGLGMLQESLRLDPKQSLANESLGFYYFRRGDRAEAARRFAEAARLDSANYLAHYYFATLSSARLDTENADLVESQLRKAIELNPGFAPAYSALADLYASRGSKLEDALKLATKAVQLEPGGLNYFISVANVLLRMDRVEEATEISNRAVKAARSNEDRAMIQSFRSEIARYQEYLTQRKAFEEEVAARRESEQSPAAEAAREREAGPSKNGKSVKSPTGATLSKIPQLILVGKISSVTCAPPAVIDVALMSGNILVTLHANNYFKIEYSSLNWKPPQDFQACRHLNGLTAKVTYNAVEGKAYAGEILSIEVRQ